MVRPLFAGKSNALRIFLRFFETLVTARTLTVVCGIAQTEPNVSRLYIGPVDHNADHFGSPNSTIAKWTLTIQAQAVGKTKPQRGIPKEVIAKNLTRASMIIWTISYRTTQGLRARCSPEGKTDIGSFETTSFRPSSSRP